MTEKKKTAKKQEVGPSEMPLGESFIADNKTCVGHLSPTSRMPDGTPRIVFVQHVPTTTEVRSGKPYSSKQSQMLLKVLEKAGFDTGKAWFTYAIKYAPRKPCAADEKWCEGMFQDELARIAPDVVVCFGAEAMRVVCGPKYQISACRGAFIDVTKGSGKNERKLPFKVFPAFQLEQVLFNEQYMPAFKRDMRLVAEKLNGTERPLPPVNNISVKTVEEVESLKLDLLEIVNGTGGGLFVALDCEWGGRNWMDPDRYFRTIQLGLDDAETVFTIEIARENGVLFEPRQKELFEAIRGILEADWIYLIGHNIIADGEWLLSFGIDIRPHVVYDTMLAEYMIDSAGPFGLEELSMKYTDFGRYSWEVELWTKWNKKTVEGPDSYGYAQVPHEMLLGYAAADVACLFPIYEAQYPILKERGYFEPRGLRGEHPSMFDTTMKMQRVLYELEINGMPTDRKQLDTLTDMYQGARSRLMNEVTALATAAGRPEFNPRSSGHLREMLFDVLKLKPVKTTEGDSWVDTVLNIGMDDEDAEDIRAATDKTTLEILDSPDVPLVHKLLQFKRIDQSCKTWLRKTDDKGQPAGLYKQLWNDGKLRSRMSQLTQTGRLRSTSPNVQNWPKQAEAYMSDIFGKGNEPPLVRTIVKPQEGWCMMEGDFKQAELFVLANLSQDENMLKALTTPGLDLHDKTAVDAFGLTILSESGDVVTEDDLVEMAAKLGGVDNDEYDHFMKSLTYVDKHGNKMSRALFKSSLRVNAKSLNFGIPYGRGAGAVALAVKSLTGDSRPTDEIKAEAAMMIKSWKTVSYPTAWQWLVEQQQKTYNPGWIENPFGRRKWAHLYPGERKASIEREFGNFCIQSSVADAVQIAMGRMLDFMKDSPFPFRLQNQIHDAVMIETPVECIDQAKDMFQRTLAGIDIPIPGTSRSFRLGIDIDVYERWGVKMK